MTLEKLLNKFRRIIFLGKSERGDGERNAPEIVVRSADNTTEQREISSSDLVKTVVSGLFSKNVFRGYDDETVTGILNTLHSKLESENKTDEEKEGAGYEAENDEVYEAENEEYTSLIRDGFMNALHRTYENPQINSVVLKRIGRNFKVIGGYVSSVNDESNTDSGEDSSGTGGKTLTKLLEGILTYKFGKDNLLRDVKSGDQGNKDGGSSEKLESSGVNEAEDKAKDPFFMALSASYNIEKIMEHTNKGGTTPVNFDESSLIKSIFHYSNEINDEFNRMIDEENSIDGVNCSEPICGNELKENTLLLSGKLFGGIYSRLKSYLVDNTSGDSNDYCNTIQGRFLEEIKERNSDLVNEGLTIGKDFWEEKYPARLSQILENIFTVRYDAEDLKLLDRSKFTSSERSELVSLCGDENMNDICPERLTDTFSKFVSPKENKPFLFDTDLDIIKSNAKYSSDFLPYFHFRFKKEMTFLEYLAFNLNLNKITKIVKLNTFQFYIDQPGDLAVLNFLTDSNFSIDRVMENCGKRHLDQICNGLRESSPCYKTFEVLETHYDTVKDLPVVGVCVNALREEFSENERVTAFLKKYDLMEEPTFEDDEKLGSLDGSINSGDTEVDEKLEQVLDEDVNLDDEDAQLEKVVVAIDSPLSLKVEPSGSESKETGVSINPTIEDLVNGLFTKKFNDFELLRRLVNEEQGNRYCLLEEYSKPIRQSFEKALKVSENAAGGEAGDVVISADVIDVVKHNFNLIDKLNINKKGNPVLLALYDTFDGIVHEEIGLLDYMKVNYNLNIMASEVPLVGAYIQNIDIFGDPVGLPNQAYGYFGFQKIDEFLFEKYANQMRSELNENNKSGLFDVIEKNWNKLSCAIVGRLIGVLKEFEKDSDIGSFLKFYNLELSKDTKLKKFLISQELTVAVTGLNQDDAGYNQATNQSELLSGEGSLEEDASTLDESVRDTPDLSEETLDAESIDTIPVRLVRDKETVILSNLAIYKTAVEDGSRLLSAQSSPSRPSDEDYKLAIINFGTAITLFDKLDSSEKARVTPIYEVHESHSFACCALKRYNEAAKSLEYILKNDDDTSERPTSRKAKAKENLIEVYLHLDNVEKVLHIYQHGQSFCNGLDHYRSMVACLLRSSLEINLICGNGLYKTNHSDYEKHQQQEAISTFIVRLECIIKSDHGDGGKGKSRVSEKAQGLLYAALACGHASMDYASNGYAITDGKYTPDKITLCKEAERYIDLAKECYPNSTFIDEVHKKIKNPSIVKKISSD